MSEGFRMNRHGSPSQELYSFLLNDDFEHLLCLIPLQLILRKEEHTDSIIPLFSQFKAQRRSCLCKKTMGNLKQDTDTVTGLAFRILARAMLQILYNIKCPLHRIMALSSLHVHDSADTAVIMLKPRIIQSFFGPLHFFQHTVIHRQRLFPYFL